MKKLIICLCLTGFFFGNANAELLFKPFVANPFEPRIGASYHFSEQKLRLDIGASFDIAQFSIFDTSKTNLGADFFTYSRLRSVGNFKFPVETSDYYFGINFSHKEKFGIIDGYTRLRFAHISSHIVDGLADSNYLTRMPFVYSREFFELQQAVQFKSTRIYAGLNYIYSTRPKETNNICPELGFDYNRKLLNWLALTAGYDFKLIGIGSIYGGANAAQLGVTFYTLGNNGVFFGFNYYSGLSMHGMFYKERDNYLGLGFQVVFY